MKALAELCEQLLARDGPMQFAETRCWSQSHQLKRLLRLCVLGVAVHGLVPCPVPAVAVSHTLGEAVANA